MFEKPIHFVRECQDNIFSSACIIDSSLILVSWILLFLSIVTFIQMTCFFGKLKFENLVIFNGIIYCIIIGTAVFTKFEFILEIGFGLHIVILSYIIRRFLHLSTSLLKRTLFPTLGQKIVFYLINIGNFVLLTLSIDIALIDSIRYFSDLIELVYRLYVVLITVFFLITGLIVLNVLSETSIDDNTEDLSLPEKDQTKKASIQKTSLKEYKETYYGKRKQQIITLIIINLITSVIQGCYCLLKNFLFINNDFLFEKHSIIPFTVLSMLAYIVYISSCLLTIIANYVSFFWVIRLEYLKSRPTQRKISLSESEIQRYSQDEENKNEDIQNYLQKSNTLKSDLVSFVLA